MDRLISEQAVIKILILLFIGSENFKVAINSIKAIPSAEPKTGHWIDRDVYDADRWKCSECGRTEPYKENYCPNCGCRMVDEQEREEV